jgi:hypothetical protein
MENKDYYFQHDYNPTNDPKIICLLGKYGGLGYGIYWRVVEMLHQTNNYKLPLDTYIFQSISRQMITDDNTVITLLNDCITKFKLFESDGKLFWSERVLQNIQERENRRIAKSNAGKLGMERRWHNTVITKNNKHNKGKESKVKESKEIIISEPSSQVNSLLKEFEEINPTINYGNKTQRKACEELISKFGYEKVVSTLNYYKSIRSDKFSPVITTPYELQQKMGQLLTFYNKSTNKPKTIIL